MDEAGGNICFLFRGQKTGAAHLPPLGRHPVQVGVRQRRLGFDLPLRQHVMSDDGNPFLSETL